MDVKRVDVKAAPKKIILAEGKILSINPKEVDFKLRRLRFRKKKGQKSVSRFLGEERVLQNVHESLFKNWQSLSLSSSRFGQKGKIAKWRMQNL